MLTIFVVHFVVWCDLLAVPCVCNMVAQGGAGFYTSDVSNKDRLFEVCPEKVLILECLGPPESEWNQQSFQVNKFGCVGGRKHNPEDSANLREIVLFKDITVSRRHFEITQQPSSDPTAKSKNFFIRDLGSAGGTFIRIRYGTRKQLHPGMIILLGKHQFTVSSVDDMGGINLNHSTDVMDTRKSVNAGQMTRKSVIKSDVIMSIVENAERIIANFSHSDGDQNSEERRQKENELSARLKHLTEELSHLQIMEEGAQPQNPSAVPGTPLEDSGGEMKRVSDSKEAFHNRELESTMKDCKDKDNNRQSPDGLHETTDANISLAAEAKDPTGTLLIGGNSGATPSKSLGRSASISYLQRRCTLTCCAPDGSPLQGMSFVVGPEGAMMGRKQSNSIALLMRINDPKTGEERIANVDTAISSEHARVEFDERTGNFYICDGTPTKPSTNGTWFRLSGPHQESPPHQLQGGAEVLIGTVRFLVKESMTISERKVDDDK